MNNQRCCSPECGQVDREIKRAKGNVEQNEDRIVTRDRGNAMEVIKTTRARGCRRVGARASGAKTRGPYYSVSVRDGGLVVIRVRWPGPDGD